MKKSKSVPKFPSMSSEQIIDILRNQHTGDVFVGECKDGPTQMGGHARLDAWVMNKSWTRLCFTGYEVKVSRNDFKQDEKWHSYLPLCNQLYFVCPKGMILPEEVPGDVGLKYATQGRILTAKKAAHRDVQPPMELFCYILMCRVKITRDNYFNRQQDETREDKLQKYRDWLKEKEESRDIGSVVAYHVARKIDDVERRAKATEERIKHLEEVDKFARELGIRQWSGEEQIKARLKTFLTGVPESLKMNLKSARDDIDRLMQTLEPHE